MCFTIRWTSSRWLPQIWFHDSCLISKRKVTAHKFIIYLKMHHPFMHRSVSPKSRQVKQTGLQRALQAFLLSEAIRRRRKLHAGHHRWSTSSNWAGNTIVLSEWLSISLPSSVPCGACWRREMPLAYRTRGEWRSDGGGSRRARLLLGTVAVAPL